MATLPYVDFSKLKVLVIDDEAFTRSTVRSQLLNIGVREIVEASDGKQGLMQTLRTRPHVVLCDIHMEPMDGLQYLVALRAQKMEGVHDIPVIFLTADAKSDVVQFARENEANGYLVKPTSTANIQARIAAVAEKIRKD